MFLTAEELKELTGYAMSAWQIRWLEAHGYKFEKSSAGRPVVLRDHVQRRMSGQDATNVVHLNFDAIKRRA